MRAAWVLLLLVGTAMADVSMVAPPPPRESGRWLSARSGLPLASAGEGTIASPQAPASCRWIARGSRWRLVDRTGRSLGETRVKKLERDEPWPCKMATFAHRDEVPARVLVDAAAPASAPTAVWTPSPRQRATFSALLRGDNPDERVPLFFESRGQRFAVGGGTVPVIARLDGDRWIVEWRRSKRPFSHEHGHEPCGASDYGYRDPAAIDLDGDGAPEVVLGWWDESEYGDWVLRRGPPGGAAPTWQLVARGLEGNTI